MAIIILSYSCIQLWDDSRKGSIMSCNRTKENVYQSHHSGAGVDRTIIVDKKEHRSASSSKPWHRLCIYNTDSFANTKCLLHLQWQMKSDIRLLHCSVEPVT